MKEIELQDFIYQVKRELLAPNPMERAKDPYPLFFIEKIDLEIVVRVSRRSDGALKLSVLDGIEAGLARTVESERGHVVRVSLVPLLPREQILEAALNDETIHKAILQRQETGMVKGDDILTGDPE